MIQKIKAFADIGRTQGITTTASIALVGAFTSTAAVEWYHIIYFTILSILAHMVLNTYIALGDIQLDSKTYVPSRNPVTMCILTKKEALWFVYLGTLLCFILVFALLFFIDTTLALLAILCDFIAFIWLIWYGWKGKKYLFSYDFSFSFSFAFFVLFGVFSVQGTPTMYTWIFIGVVACAATAFAQWENGLKDVNADRSAGVRSFAVVTQVKNNQKLGYTHPYFLYGTLLKIGFLFFCFLSYFLYEEIIYLLFIILFGIPSQLFILKRFATKEKPLDHRKTILLDVTFAATLGYTVIIGKTGIIPIIFLILYLIIGYLLGSLIQSNCEFKFSRFSSKKS